MKIILRRIAFVLFWQLVFVLVLLRLPRELYAEWLVGFGIGTLLSIVFSFRFVPGKREEEAFLKLRKEFEENVAALEDVRSQALRLEMSCPGCKTKSSYWSFLEDYKCDKCGSDLWVSTLKKYPAGHSRLFEKRDRAFAFNNRLSSRVRRRLRRLRGLGL